MSVAPVPTLRAAAFALGLATLLAAAPSGAAEPTMVAPDAMAWADGPPTLPPGPQITVLSGNPGEAGPFVLRLKFPGGYEIPAHRHSKAENITVVSGTLNIGHGETLDRAATRPMQAGAYVSMPAGAPHYVWTGAETVVQLHGEGPFDITYVDPASDPRGAAATN